MSVSANGLGISPGFTTFPNNASLSDKEFDESESVKFAHLNNLYKSPMQESEA